MPTKCQKSLEEQSQNFLMMAGTMLYMNTYMVQVDNNSFKYISTSFTEEHFHDTKVYIFMTMALNHHCVNLTVWCHIIVVSYQ